MGKDYREKQILYITGSCLTSKDKNTDWTLLVYNNMGGETTSLQYSIRVKLPIQIEECQGEAR